MNSSRGAPQVAVARGRPFVKGNPGRKKGSRNKSTEFTLALLEGEREELVRKGIELAKGGDVPMLKFLLGRLLPRDRLISIDLPQILSASDAREALRSVLRAISAGAISAAEGAALAALISPFLEGAEKRPSSRDLTLTLAEHLQSPEKE